MKLDKFVAIALAVALKTSALQVREPGACQYSLSNCANYDYGVAVESTSDINNDPFIDVGVIATGDFQTVVAQMRDSDSYCGTFDEGWTTTCNPGGTPWLFSGPDGSGFCVEAVGSCLFTSGIDTITYNIHACCNLS